MSINNLMMRKLKFYISPVAFLLFLQFTCCDKETEVQAEITLAKEEINFSTINDNQTLAIKTNLDWTATSSEDWCTITPASGEPGTKQLKVEVQANVGDGARQSTITITAGKLSKQVIVKQSLEKLVLATKQYNVEAAVNEITVNIQASPAYSNVSQPGWITLKSTSPDTKTQTFTIAANNSVVARKGKIIYKSGNLTDTVSVKQAGLPLSIPADATGMTSNAKTLAAKMFLGLNIGNTLEAPGAETAWGNPKINQAFIDSAKAAGFNGIRLPCAWNSHLEDTITYKIYDTWLTRVKEVVDYCYKADMYVVLNIHWDGGWLEENPVYAKQAAINAKQKALWEQIAYHFRDYDEHLLFAGTNEVHAGYGEPTAENIAVQLSFNQTFVDAVRSTGGKNAYRNLVVQAYNTNINQAVQYLKMPTDKVVDRLMVEVHYYDPWDFCGDNKSSIYLWGKNFAAYGNISSYGQENYVDQQFAKMKTNFVDKGFPVILGEFGPQYRATLTGTLLANHKASRAYYMKYVVQQAKNNGMVPFLWDTGGDGTNSSPVLLRANGKPFDTQSLDALNQGATAGVYPF
jgi:endoglucanase